MRKYSLILGILVLFFPIYHHLLWIYIWINNEWLTLDQKTNHFYQLSIFPNSVHTLLSFILSITAIILLITSAKKMQTNIQKLTLGSLMILAILSWALTAWSLL